MSPTADRWLIHRHLARQQAERLALVSQTPRRILLAGADGDESRRLLADRFPQAVFTEYDPRQDALDEAQALRPQHWLAKLAGKRTVQHCQAADAPLPAGAADWLWSNLNLIHAPHPVPVFERWADALRNDGLLFFTHFGIDSLHGLADRLRRHGIETELPELPDMHDLGDMLYHHGFYDPVMDTARLQLDYRSAEALWQDWDTLGLAARLSFSDEAAARALLAEWAADGLTVTLETVFGHAVKKAAVAAGESTVRFFPPQRTPNAGTPR